MAASKTLVSERQIARRAQAWHSLAALHLASNRTQTPLFGDPKQAADRASGHRHHYAGKIPLECLRVPGVMD